MNYREKCLAEKGEECELCGSSENIEVHHINDLHSNNELSNLMPVCRECHNKIHSNSPEHQEWSEKLVRPLTPAERMALSDFEDAIPFNVEQKQELMKAINDTPLRHAREEITERHIEQLLRAAREGTYSLEIQVDRRHIDKLLDSGLVSVYSRDLQGHILLELQESC